MKSNKWVADLLPWPEGDIHATEVSARETVVAGLALYLRTRSASHVDEGVPGTTTVAWRSIRLDVSTVSLILWEKVLARRGEIVGRVNGRRVRRMFRGQPYN